MTRGTAAWWRTAARVVRPVRGPLAAIAVVAALGAALGGLAVPALDHLATAGTRADLGRALETDRDVALRFPLAPPGGDTVPDSAAAQDAFDGLHDDLVAQRRAMPAALRRVVDEPGYAASTPYAFLAAEPAKVPAAVSLTTDRAFAARVHWSAGRAPRAGSDPAVIEVALSSSASRRIGWPVGTERRVVDPLGAEVALRLSGVYAVDRADDPAWAYEPRSRSGGLLVIAQETYEIGAAFTAPDESGTVAAHGWFVQGQAWYPVRTTAVGVADRTAIAAAARSFTGRSRELPSIASSLVRPMTGLPALLDASLARDRTVRTLAVAAASGPAAAGIALQVLLAALLVARERERWELLAARGAGRVRIGGLLAAMVGAVSVPAAIVGAAVAAAGAAALGTLGTAVWTIVVLAACGALLPVVAAAALAPTIRVGRPRRPVRVLVESVLVVVTVVAAVITARSGVGTTASSGGVDPLAALLPVLLPLTGVALAGRVVPGVLRAIRRRARNGTGLGPVGLAGAAGTGRGAGSSGPLPLAAATVGIAVALFASVLGSTLVHGVADAAARSVGADVSVTGAAFTADDVARMRRVAGVASVAAVSTTDDVTFDTRSGQITAVVLVADTARLHRVQAGVPGAVDAPQALTARGGAVPLLVSQSVAAAVGDRSDVLGTAVRRVGTAPDATPFTAAANWVLVDASRADEITDTGSSDRVLVRVAAGGDPGSVAATLRSMTGVTAATTAESAGRRLADDPRIPGTRGIAVVAAAVGAAAGIGALGVAAVLTGPRRRRSDAMFVVLGAVGSDRRRAVLAEEVPALVTAAATAVLAAVAIVLLTIPAADLRSFTGGAVRPGVALDPALLGAVGAGVVLCLAAVASLAVAAGTTRGAPRGRGRARQGRGRARRRARTRRTTRHDERQDTMNDGTP